MDDRLNGWHSDGWYDANGNDPGEQQFVYLPVAERERLLTSPKHLSDVSKRALMPEADVVNRLGVDDEWCVRRVVAEHPLAEGDVLTDLAHETDPYIVEPVANHLNTPIPALIRIRDTTDDDDVKSAASTNITASDPQTPLGTLEELLKHPDVRVKERALRNLANNPQWEAYGTPLSYQRHLYLDLY